MPRKSKAGPPDGLAPIPAEILDQFVRRGPLTPEVTSPPSAGSRKRSSSAALGAELSHHLGYVPGGEGSGFFGPLRG